MNITLWRAHPPDRPADGAAFRFLVLILVPAWAENMRLVCVCVCVCVCGAANKSTHTRITYVFTTHTKAESDWCFDIRYPSALVRPKGRGLMPIIFQEAVYYYTVAEGGC